MSKSGLIHLNQPVRYIEGLRDGEIYYINGEKHTYHDPAIQELDYANALQNLLFNYTEWQRDGLRMVNIEEVRRIHHILFGENGPFSFVNID